MKKCIALLIVIILLPAAFAESVDVSVYQDIAVAMGIADVWRVALEDAVANISDEDSKYVLEQVSNQMLIYAYELTLSADPNQSCAVANLLEGMEELQPESINEENWHYAQGAWQDIEEQEIYSNCSVLYEENYMQLIRTAYGKNGILDSIRVVETASRKDGSVLMLFVEYDEEMGATGRYAVLLQGNDAQCIYTKTFGMTLDVVLDVKEWQNGTDPEVWSKELLYPASFLYAK